MKLPPEIDAAIEWLIIYALVGWSLTNTEYGVEELVTIAYEETDEYKKIHYEFLKALSQEIEKAKSEAEE